MRRVRVRWTSAAKAAAIAVAALVALQALPALLKPPEPPPLAADVGLPKVVPQEQAPQEPVRRRGLERPRGITGLGPAKVVSRSGRRRHRKRRHPEPTPAPAAPTS